MINQKTIEESSLRNVEQMEIHAVYVKSMLKSNLEQNRQLFLIASLALGLLMGVFNTDELSRFFSFTLWLFSALCFITCAIAALVFFNKNTEYLRSVIEKNHQVKLFKKTLDKISDIASMSFICGIILLFVLVMAESRFVGNKEPRRSNVVFIPQYYPRPQFHHCQEGREKCSVKNHGKKQQQSR